MKLTLHLVRVGIVWFSCGLVGAQAALLLQEVFGLLRLRLLQIIHYKYDLCALLFLKKINYRL